MDGLSDNIMGGASKHQKEFFYPKVVNLQHGEYCKGCGFSSESKNFKDKSRNPRKFTGLILDKINNDHNHNICDNESEDFQILCIVCNGIKNPRGKSKPENNLRMTYSERKNKNAEKPMMNELKTRLEAGEVIPWKQWVCDAAFDFDVSTEPTIEERYYAKYFKSKNGPFELYYDNFDTAFIKLKNKDPNSEPRSKPFDK